MSDKPTQDKPDNKKSNDATNNEIQSAGCTSPVIGSGLDTAKNINPCNKIPKNPEKETMIG